MTQIQPYFDKKKIKSLAIVVTTLFALSCATAWLIKSFTRIHFDWSFLLPFLGIASSSFPIGAAVIDWFEKRLSIIDERLDRLEYMVKSLERQLEITEEERHELRGKIIRLEVTYRAFINK